MRSKNKDKIYLNFEMQLNDGEIKGIGKEYNEDGKLIFEGEIYNGVKNGYGKDYFLNGKLMFEGIYINDEKFIGFNYNNKGMIKNEIKNGEEI